MCLFKECRSIRKFGLIQDYYRESQLEIRKKCTFSFYFIVRGKCQYGEGLLKLGCHSVKTVLDDEIVITTLHCSVLKFPRDGIKRWERQYLLRLKLCVGSELYFLVSRPRPRAEGGAVWPTYPDKIIHDKMLQKHWIISTRLALSSYCFAKCLN